MTKSYLLMFPLKSTPQRNHFLLSLIYQAPVKKSESFEVRLKETERAYKSDMHFSYDNPGQNKIRNKTTPPHESKINDKPALNPKRAISFPSLKLSKIVNFLPLVTL